MAAVLPIPLFLDFDGVLHRFFPVAGESDESNQHFFFLPAFENAVRALPVPVEIVIASTWRNKRPIDAIRALFSPDIAAKIVGVTPKVGSGVGPGGRQVEVEEWMKKTNRTGQPWIGIDDYPELYNPGAAVVVCHDQFAEREAALLAEAVADVSAFARKYPVPSERREKLIIVTPGEPRKG